MMGLFGWKRIPQNTIVRIVLTEYEQVTKGGEYGVLKFVVYKMEHHYWAIYYGKESWPTEDILRNGDKVTSPYNIQDMFPCEEEVAKLYNH